MAELRQIIRTILIETLSEPFDLGKPLGTKVYFKNLGYSAKLYKSTYLHTGLPTLVWQVTDENLGAIKELLGQLWENGKIQFKGFGQRAFLGHADNWGLKDFDGGLKKAVKYIWLKRQDTKQHIEEIVLKKNLNAALGEKVIAEFPDVDGMYVTTGTSLSMLGKFFFHSKNGDSVGVLSQIGKTLQYAESGQHGIETIPNFVSDTKLDNLKKVARYIWLKRQNPAKQLSESYNKFPVGKFVAFPDIDGWGITRTQFQGTLMIMSKNAMTHMGTLSDGSNRHDKQPWLGYNDYFQKGHQGWKHIIPWDFNNIKNAVRYVYLQNQKLKNKKIVDELNVKGNSDLENYYDNNPASLNNDYVDNFLNNKNYFQKTEIPHNIPDSW